MAQPAPETLEAIAMRLKVSPAFFTREAVESTEPPFFRSLSRVPAGERDRAHAYAVALADAVKVIEQDLEFPGLEIKPLLSAREDTEIESIEAAAQEARVRWRVPPGPIANAVAMAESRGVVVAAVGSFHEGIDAFSLTGGPRPVVVLCSKKGVATRRRFDLAHELGHIVLHDRRAEEPRWQERQAHRFASALLMPAADIRPHLPTKPDDLRALERVAHDWGVSMQAALMRARDLGTIDTVGFTRAMRRMSAAGWRTREPIEVGPPEVPQLLLAAVASLPPAGTSLGAVAERLGLPLGRLERMLQVPEERDDTYRGQVVPLAR